MIQWPPLTNDKGIIKDIIGEALLKVRGDNIIKEHLKVEKTLCI